jgi:hypothetical protein
MKNKSISSLVSESHLQSLKLRELMDANERLLSEVTRLSRDLVSSREQFESQLSIERERF